KKQRAAIELAEDYHTHVDQDVLKNVDAVEVVAGETKLKVGTELTSPAIGRTRAMSTSSSANITAHSVAVSTTPLTPVKESAADEWLKVKGLMGSKE
ncbi:hypothetical protein HDU76_011492, partial [Blyttiomyces sp. JEL0837]